MSFGRLDERVVLITGGGSGSGAAAVRRLAALGADVAIVDRNLEWARAVAAEVEAAGRRSLALELDLSDVHGILAAVERVLSELGRIDVLIQCAYVHGRQAGFPETLLEARAEDVDLACAVHVKAPLLLMQHVARHMIERGGGGRIVNVTSTSAFRADSAVIYGATKAALNQMTRTVAAELGPHGITVNNVAPALTRSPSALSVRGADDLERSVREGSRKNLLGRVAEPEDVAAAIVFLCLPDARHFTAQTLFPTAGASL